MPKSAKFFVAIVTVAALAAFAASLVNATWGHPTQFAILLVVTFIASRFKVSLPGLEGSLSVNLPFVLIAAVHLGMAEAVILGLLSTLVQSISKPMSARKFTQVQFNCATIMLVTAAAQFASVATTSLFGASSLAVVAASVAYLAINVGLVGTVMALSTDAPVAGTVGEVFTLTFPHFVIGAGVANLVMSTEKLSWLGAVAGLAVMIGVCASYRRLFAKRVDKEEMQL